MPNETILLNRGRVNLQQLQSQQAATKTARPEKNKVWNTPVPTMNWCEMKFGTFSMNEHNKLVQDALFNKKRKPEVERIIPQLPTDRTKVCGRHEHR